MSIVSRSMGFVGGGKPYTTFDPANAGTGLTLAAGNLSITANPNTYFVRSLIGKSSGKWEWEFPVPGSNAMLGVCNASANMSSLLYTSANGWFMYTNDGHKYNGSDGGAYGGTVGSSVVRVRLDMDAGTLSFSVGGVDKGTAFSGLSGTIYACAGYQGTPTAYFGPISSPDAGFNAGLY